MSIQYVLEVTNPHTTITESGSFELEVRRFAGDMEHGLEPDVSLDQDAGRVVLTYKVGEDARPLTDAFVRRVLEKTPLRLVSRM